MDRIAIRRSEAYRRLLAAWFYESERHEQSAAAAELAIYSGVEWQEQARPLTAVQALSSGDWAADLLLVHPYDPYVFKRHRGQAYRSQRLASIVASYSSKVGYSDENGCCRPLTLDDLGLCDN